jgi:hypothetical protein
VCNLIESACFRDDGSQRRSTNIDADQRPDECPDQSAIEAACQFTELSAYSETLAATIYKAVEATVFATNQAANISTIM